MKTILTLILILIFAFPEISFAENKALVAYFSWSGNTAALAKTIAELTGFDLFEIKTVKPYSQNYDEILNVAKKEQNNKARPELVENIKNFEQYDTIFLGYPCWWGNAPMAVFSFLEKNNFSGKRVIPFVTHGGSAFGRSINDLKKTVPSANIESSGLAVSGTASRQEVASWLKELRFSVKN